MAVKYLQEQRYVKVPVYAAVGKYYEMRKSDSTFDDLNFNINAPVVTSSTLNARDLINVLFTSDKDTKWFSDLSEKEIFENGVNIVFDKIVSLLNKNIGYTSWTIEICIMIHRFIQSNFLFKI